MLKIILIAHILIIIVIPAKLSSQQNLAYQFFVGTNATIPIFSYESNAFGSDQLTGNGKIGFLCTAEVLKKFDSFFVGLKTKFDQFGYGFNTEFTFPEDALAGTISTIESTNTVNVLGFGIGFGSILFNSDWFIRVGPNVEFEISNKSFQQIVHGYDPSIIDIADGKDDIYESGVNSALDFTFGNNIGSSNKFGIMGGLQFYLNTFKYYTFSWDVRPIKFYLGLSYNLNNESSY
jgi:hypothetical protein